MGGAAAYIRVSTEEQREKQTSETQRDRLTQYFAFRDIPVPPWYVDEGWSGALPLAARPAGGRLLADARAGRVSVVYVSKLDRLARGARVTLNAVHELEEAGCGIVSATESFDTTTPAGRALLGMLATFAGFERETITERTMDGLDRLARQGVWVPSACPTGYRVTDDRRLVPDEEPGPSGYSPADAVRMIFALCLDGCGAWEIAGQLDALGIPPRTAARWRHSAVLAILHNPAYRGEAQWRRRAGAKRQPITIPCPPLVPEEAWHAAQERLTRNRKYARAGSSRVYLLSGLLRCGNCDRPLVVAGSRQGYHFYGCASRQYPREVHGPWCGLSAMQAEPAEAEAWARCLERLTDPRAWEEPEPERRETGERERLERAIQAQSEQRRRVLRLFERGLTEEAEMDAALAAITAALTALNARLAALGLPDAPEARIAAQARRERLREAAEAATDPAARREVLAQAVESITVREEARPRHGSSGPRRAFTLLFRWRV